MLKRPVSLFFVVAASLALVVSTAAAADYPNQKSGVWIAKNFKFHTGDVMADMPVGYTTVGNPDGDAVLILHGTTGTSNSSMGANFAGILFGPGQPLDAAKHYIILPDGIGGGKSAKPSDGMRGKFPRYDYVDMVEAQYRLVTEGLGVKHLRVIVGNSMGGMHTWMWGTRYPGFADILVPLASQPTEMSSRNWMMRKLLIESIRRDPTYMGGDYTEQPKFMKYANALFGIGTNGGTFRWQAIAGTRSKADAYVEKLLAEPLKADANDFVYRWDASRNYDPSPDLGKITATVLAINSADDERNPHETGLMAEAMKQVKNGRIYLVPASAETNGHSAVGNAKWWKDELVKVLATAPRMGN